MDKFPVLLYDPAAPVHIIAAENPRVLYANYNKGFKKVDLKRVGTAVKKIRRRFKLTVEEFSSLLFTHGFVVSPQHIKEYESHKNLHRITVPFIRMLAEMFGSPVDDVVVGRSRVTGVRIPKAVKKLHPVKLYRVRAISSEHTNVVAEVFASSPSEARKLSSAHWKHKYGLHGGKVTETVEVTSTDKGVIWSTVESRTTTE